MEIRAKEKAWQLYNTYRKLEGKWGDKVMYNYDAKQCTLIAVEEIINVLKGFHFGIEFVHNLAYWEQVKEEI